MIEGKFFLVILPFLTMTIACKNSKIISQFNPACLLLIFPFSQSIKRTIHSDLLEVLADVD